MKNIRITNTLAALAWLGANGFTGTGLERHPRTGALVVVENNSCHRCGGSGNTGHFWVNGGTCFACGGNGDKRKVRTSVKKYASKRKAKKTADARREKARIKKAADIEARRLEGELKWCEDNGHGRITFAELNAKREAERNAAKELADDVPTGRTEVTGTVLSVKAKDSYYGTTMKMLVESTTGFRVYGTLPKALDSYDENGKCVHVGKEVTFTATLEPSKDDAKFGFYKRPHVAA